MRFPLLVFTIAVTVFVLIQDVNSAATTSKTTSSGATTKKVSAAKPASAASVRVSGSTSGSHSGTSGSTGSSGTGSVSGHTTNPLLRGGASALMTSWMITTFLVGSSVVAMKLFP